MQNKGYSHVLLLLLAGFGLFATILIASLQAQSRGQVLSDENENLEEEDEFEEDSKEKERDQKETEIKTSTGETIKTKVEDDGSIKIIYKDKNRELELETHADDDKTSTDSSEVEVEIEDEDEDETEHQFDLAKKRLIDSGQADFVASPQAELKIEIKNGVDTIKLESFKTKKLLGIFPIEVRSTSFVATESGQIVAQVKSLLDQILSLLSTF